jgi:gliding motility-associated-like protein
MPVRRIFWCLLPFLALYTHSLFGQVNVDADLTPEQLIRNVFIGEGVDVSNIRYSGRMILGRRDQCQFGRFTSDGIDPPNFFKKGIILSTGVMRDVPGPNTNPDKVRAPAPGANEQIDFNASDPDLYRAVNGIADIRDAAVIEFDFIPYSDKVSFRYIFASEEYEEYVDSTYNDVFGFFIRGGTQYPQFTNIALIPGTNQPVAINSVNHKRNTQYYISNQCPGDCVQPGNQGPFNIEYDGFTTVLTAEATVTPCVTYRFKLAIGDVYDGKWDSGVFLEGGSFSAKAGVKAEGGLNIPGKNKVTTFESCEDNIRFKFTRQDASTPLTVPLTFTGTATKDIDYIATPDFVDFAVGDTVTYVNIKVLFDRFYEGDETIIVTFAPPFLCRPVRDTIVIMDLDTMLTVSPKLSLICHNRPDTVITVSASINNGVKDMYRFVWRDRKGNIISTRPEFDLTLNSDTTIYIEVSDTVCKAPAAGDSLKIQYFYNDPTTPFRIGAKDSSICSGSNFILQNLITGGRPPYRFEWRNIKGDIISNDPDLSFTNFNKDTIVVLHVEERQACKRTLTKRIELKVNPPLQFARLPDMTVCADQNFTLNPNAIGSGKFVHQWRNLSTNQILALTPTYSTRLPVRSNVSYEYTVRDSCFVGKDTIRVTTEAPIEWSTINLSHRDTLCPGDEIRLEVNVTGGRGDYTYYWNNEKTSNIITEKPTQDIALAVVVSDGCSVIDTTFYFIVAPKLSVKGLQDTVICQGESVTIRSKIVGGKGVDVIEWKDGAGNVIGSSKTLTVSPARTSNYVLSVLDRCGQLASDTITITVLPKPGIFMPSVLETCLGVPVKATGTIDQTNGCFYTWTPATGLDNPLILNPTFNPNVSTTYTLTTVCNGCVSNQHVLRVNVNPIPNVSFNDPIVFRCVGDNGVTLEPNISNGTGNYTYRWQPINDLDLSNPARPIATPNKTTTYTLTVTDNKGCIAPPAFVSVEVSVPAEGSIQAEYAICPNAPGVRLRPQINFVPKTDQDRLSYQWFPTDGLNDPTLREPIASPQFTTTYTLTVMTLPSGCVNAQVIRTVVRRLPTPTANAGADQNICPNGSALIGVPLAAQDSGVVYRWSPTTGLNNPKIKQPIASPKHTTTYFVVAEKDGCQSLADSVTVFVKPAPTLSVRRNYDMCLGQTVKLNAVVGTGFEPYSYEWSPAEGLSDPNILEPDASPSQTTTYTLRVSTPNCTAQITDTARVTVLPLLIIDADTTTDFFNTQTIRKGGSIVIPASVKGNPKEYSVEWSPTTGLNRADVLNPVASPTEDTRYTMTVKRGNCMAMDEILIRVITKPDVEVLPNPATLCSGSSTRLEARATNGNVIYFWQPRTGILQDDRSSIVVSPKETTTYTVVITDQDFGEKDTATAQVIVRPKPTPKIETSIGKGCDFYTVQFTDTNPASSSWVWDFGDSSALSNEHHPTHTYTKPGLYRVKLKTRSIHGCEDSATLTYRIRVSDQGLAKFSTFPQLPAVLQLPDAGIMCFDSSTYVVSRLWDFGDGYTSTAKNPTHIYKTQGEFVIRLTITDSAGCTHTSDQGSVLVEGSDFVFPNVFTPNNDGINDTWYPIYNGNEPFSFYITSRWGIRVFEGRKGDSWDGNAENGEKQPEGTYFYFLKIGDKFYRGEITLTR